jgi:hypothetical protein
LEHEKSKNVIIYHLTLSTGRSWRVLLLSD